MNKVKDGGPAFPCDEKNDNGTHHNSNVGMSLRDWFAGQVLSGLTSSPVETASRARIAGLSPQDFATQCAYEMADAMLTERDRVASPAGETIRSTRLRGNTREFAEANFVVTTRGKVIKSTIDGMKIVVVDHLTGERAL